MFRWIVAICLALVAYGVLYRNLPCWAQLLDKTMYCQLMEAAEKERQFRAAHQGKPSWLVGLERRAEQTERSNRKKRGVELEIPPTALSTLPESAAALPEALSGTVSPVLIRQVDAEYSEEALAAKREGTVTLAVEVDATGRVVNPRVVRSRGPGLDEKALEAVLEWRYRPALKDGHPISFPMQIEFNFRLGKK